MMKSTIKQWTAVGLLGVFAIPVLIPALHELFEDHEHFICTAVDVDHLHEKVIECDLCDYLIGLKPITSEAEEEYTQFLVPDTFEQTIHAPVPAVLNAGYYLRGPPVA